MTFNRLLAFGAIFSTILFLVAPAIVIAYIILFIAFLRLVSDRFDYQLPTVAFLIPWLVMFIFVNLPITEYTRHLEPLTVMLMCAPILSVLIIEPFQISNTPESKDNIEAPFNIRRYQFCLLLLIILFFINAAYSGYLPLLNALSGGNSDYLDYGIKGLNGMFYAYANCFGMLAYYLYLSTRSRTYQLHLILVFILFLLCLTRQNIISLLVEIAIIHAFVRGGISKLRLGIIILTVLIAFGLLGSLRSGDITELMQVRSEYKNLPNAFIWAYAYGFFNVINLDNAVYDANFGLFDGSSLASLLPSFLRPDYDGREDLLEVRNLNVRSYLFPLLIDIGPWGIILFTAAVVYFTCKSYKLAKNAPGFKSIAVYAVLYFSALFSFFINFWTYLPIIFQVPFAYFLSSYVFKENMPSNRRT
jgi:oligosaccharide repeat unit polymerase